MEIKKTRVQFTLFEEFEQLDAVMEALKDYPGYEELTSEEIIKRISENEAELSEEDVGNMKDTLEGAKFAEIEDGIILVSSRMISITVESGVDEVQDIVRGVLDSEDAQYEEDISHSLEVESSEQVLDASLEEILGEYSLNIVINGEKGTLSVNEGQDSTAVNGDKPLLENLKQVISDEK